MGYHISSLQTVVEGNGTYYLEALRDKEGTVIIDLSKNRIRPGHFSSVACAYRLTQYY